MKRLMMGLLMLLLVVPVLAQEAEIVKSESVQAAEAAPEEVSGFLDVVKGGGAFGMALWLGLAGLSLAAGALIVDSVLNIRTSKIIPKTLVSLVREAIEDGSVKKAAQRCKDVPGPYSNILLAGFENVEDGFDSAQEAIGIAADMESEKMLQRVNYLNVVGNLAPMLGLLGTVQGMILAFATLGTTSGAAKNALLAINISQALYTTAAGLVIAVPAIGSYFFFRNRAAKVILTMEGLTMEVMKGLKKKGESNV
ncbi:MotA/TolQ/ExbB proton channel family protein [Pontiellaceae bacterium B12219]|nr:MotA/TolQ/ExbB proton channel family protein [Pontiellaceae bacterium B12219]